MQLFSALLEWIAQSTIALVSFSAVIVIVAIVFATKYQRRITRLCEQIDALAAIVAKSSVSSKRGDLRDLVRRSEIAETYLARRFDAYLNTLVRSTLDGQSRLLSSVPATEAMGIREVGAHEINFRVYQGIPNVLIGLGLLFTFIGLTAALMAATEGATASDVTVAQKALSRLLGAATFKFVTSLLGLLTSLGFGFFEKRQYHLLNDAFNRLHRVLQNHFPYLTTQNLLSLESSKSSIQRAARISTIESLAVFNESLEDPVGLALLRQDISQTREEAEEQTKILKTFSTDLAASIAKAIDESLSPQLTTTFAALQDTIQGIGHQLNSTNADALRSIVEDFNNQFEAQAKNSVLEMVSVIETVTNSISSSSERFTAAFDQLQSLAETVRSEGLRGLEATKGLLSGLEVTVTRLEGISEQLRAAAAPVSLAAEHSGSLIEALRDAQVSAAEMVAKLPSIADGFTGIDRDLASVFDTIHSSLTRELDDIRSFVSELDGSFSKTLGGVHEVTSSLSSAVDDLTTGLSDLSTVISGVRAIDVITDGSSPSRASDNDNLTKPGVS